jgi:hypothetical protein
MMNILIYCAKRLRPSVHGRCFAAAVKLSRRPIISWLCARMAKERLRSHIFPTICCSQCVRYTSTRHLPCHNMFYDHTVNLDVARRIDNCRLTRARRIVECAFGILCNKLRIFHCAIDVCPVSAM